MKYIAYCTNRKGKKFAYIEKITKEKDGWIQGSIVRYAYLNAYMVGDYKKKGWVREIYDKGNWFSHAMSGIRIDSKFLIDAKLPNDFMEGDLSHVIGEADIVIKNMNKLKQKIKNYKKG